LLSSPACWAAYGEVSSRAYLDPQRLEVLQVQIDAYAVQHPAVMSVEQRSRWAFT